MHCLHCGDCCLRMSPISAPKPCPHIDQRGNFYFCGCYEKRPEDCVNHSFPAHVCPIGMGKLNLSDSEAMRQRLDNGHALLKCGGNDANLAINVFYRGHK